jgi:hypothetical protein
VGHIFGIERNEKVDGDGICGLKKFLEMAALYHIPMIGEPPAKTKDGFSGLGGIFDYNVVKHIYPLTEEVEIC